jgi:hypothetical protein
LYETQFHRCFTAIAVKIIIVVWNDVLFTDCHWWHEVHLNIYIELCCISYKSFTSISDFDIFLQCTEWWYVWPQGESFYNPYIPGVIEQLDKLGLVEESDGARVIYVEGVNIPLIAVKRDGGYNYFSTDLASLWLVLPYRFFVHIFE